MRSLATNHPRWPAIATSQILIMTIFTNVSIERLGPGPTSSLHTLTDKRKYQILNG
jgi:hypothetical protein